MNDQIQKILAELMTKVANGIDGVVDFGKAEIPEVIKEYIMYNGIVSSTVCVFCVLTVAVLWFISTKISRKWKLKQQNARHDYDAGVAWTRYNNESRSLVSSNRYDAIMGIDAALISIVGYGITFIIALLLSPTIFTNAKTVLMIVFAPRVYLITEAMNLYNSIH